MNALSIALPLLGILCAVSPQNATTTSCVNQWLRDNPALRTRFTRSQISWLCENTDKWFTKAREPQETTADDIVTPKQKRFINDLRTCIGKNCLGSVISQRCKGRQCRVNRPSPREPFVPPTVVLATEQAKPIDDAKMFADLNIKDVTPMRIVTTLVDGIPDGEHSLKDLVDGPTGDECTLKRWASTNCPKIIEGSNAKQIFPEAFEGKSRRETNVLNRKGRALKTRCKNIRTRLTRLGMTFESLADCANLQSVSLKRSQAANACIRVLTASTPTEALPRSKATGQQLERSYREAVSTCATLQQELTKQAKTFDSWKAGSGLSADAVPFQTRPRTVKQSVPWRQGGSGTPIDADALAFDDIDNIDFRAERVEYRMMTDDERYRFHDAMNVLKTDMIDGLSKYDLLVIYHTPQESPGAHWGPAFLPFHREILKQLEIALRQVDPDVALPYWDSTLDQGLPEPKDSILWTDEFLGNGDGEVVTGPFAGWDTTHELSFVPGMKKLFRDVGTSPYGGLYKETDVEFIASRTKYEELTACVDPTVELVHGLAHMFVGGFMADIGISPNDPSFFLHHNFIDYMWEEFRLSQQTVEEREADYPTDDMACNSFHFGDEQMRPFNMKNREGLSNNYTSEIYYYYPRPTCSKEEPECMSPYLYCDELEERCLSKIRNGGNCKGFEGTEICMDGICSEEGICEAWDEGTTETPLEETTPDEFETTTEEPTTTTTRATTTTTRPTTTTTRATTTTTPRPTTTSTWEPEPETTTDYYDFETTTEEPTTTTTRRTTTTTRRTTTTTRPTTTTTRRTTTTPRPTTTTTRRPTTTIDPRVEPRTPFPEPATTTLGGSTSYYPTVYFTISVIRGNYNFYKQPVPGATVESVGMNVPNGYTQTMPGKCHLSSSHPYYVGAATVAVMDPEKAGYFPLIQARVDVNDEMGRPCKPHCYQASSKQYIPCSNFIRLSTNTYYSDPIPFRKTEEEALNALWKKEGYYRRRGPDYLMFQC